ncbi:unnamed protein product, partial [Mesorhabditis belari]|uniref:Uncharacterized protein n=1 Tax=Mesorhabditis belari TaxID=2138241 RepID=A0AAF3EI17_9BILA
MVPASPNRVFKLQLLRIQRAIAIDSTEDGVGLDRVCLYTTEEMRQRVSERLNEKTFDSAYDECSNWGFPTTHHRFNKPAINLK